MHDRYKFLNDDEYEGTTGPLKKKRSKPKRSQAEILAELAEVEDNMEGAFNSSFNASRHERAWIDTYLGPFYYDHVIVDVLRQVKGGKEANVYCCKAHPATGVELLAAKVYRPRMFRNLSNDALYRQNRTIIDSDGKSVKRGGALVAVQKKSSFGLELAHGSWLAHEYETMRLLFSAGADVPRPFALGENTILMEYVGDEATAASTLNHLTLRPDEVRRVFERVIENVELMLAHGRVHGDLSAYNVLYWRGGIKIIDFPQAVNPGENPDGRMLFERDVRRVCQYFTRYGIDVDYTELAGEIWSRHVVADTLMPLVLMRQEEA